MTGSDDTLMRKRKSSNSKQRLAIPMHMNTPRYMRSGAIARALEWLDTAVRLRDAGLSNLKTDPLMVTPLSIA